MTLPAVLCVDVEPDPREPPVPSPPAWAGFERVLDDVDRLRKRLSQPTGHPAQIGWFLRMDPQVAVAHGHAGWVAERYATDLAGLRRAGDELGLHPHSWRRDGDRWVSDQSPDWVAHCATVALDAYVAAFGEPCRAYRHGDRFTSDALTTLLRARGVRCDLGLEPGRPAVAGLDPAEASLGTLPAIPADRVHPFVVGGERPGDDALLVIPLTSSYDPAPQVDGARFGPLLLWSPPRTFATLLAARLAGGDVRHLAFALRTDVALIGGTLERVEENLELVASTFGAALEWVTPSEARRRLLTDALPDLAWPHSLSLDALHAVARDAAATLQHEELARLWLQEQSIVTVAHLEGALDDARTDLADARAVAATLREELATIRSTQTWRLHQRLLPALRLLRHPFGPRRP